MKVTSSAVLRVGLGITFLWIGILIFQHPDGWANFLNEWFIKLLPVSPVSFMKVISFLDMALGLAFIFNLYIKATAAIASIHLVGILLTSGITDVTVRDIGLLGATLMIYMDAKTWHLK